MQIGAAQRWVMTRYRAYAEGGEEPPAEFVAWAHWLMSRGFAYSHLEQVLETAEQKRPASGEQWVRPLPRDSIIQASTLRAFWAEGGAEGILRKGLLFVDLEGDLLTPQDYEQRRRRLVPEESNVSSSTQGSDPDVDYGAKTYRAWVASRTGSTEEGVTSLEHMPLAVRCWASKLAKWIENSPYVLHPRIDPVS